MCVERRTVLSCVSVLPCFLRRDNAVVCFHAAHYEKLNFQLQKQYRWDHITGLLLLHPTCLLHIIEVSFTAKKPIKSIRILVVRRGFMM